MTQPHVLLSTPVRVQWGDCDPAGIAFYPRFFEWMDQASHALARALGIPPDDMLPPRSLGLPLVAARAEFLAPARYGDALEVRTIVTRVGRSSFGLRHEIVRAADAPVVLLARGWEERVFVGPDERGAMRSRELPPELRDTLARYAVADSEGV